MNTLNKVELEVAGCLRRLLKSRFFLRSANEKWFQTMIDHHQALQSILNKMFFRLEINETLGVIYLRPESEEIEDRIGFQMQKRKSLSMFASIITMQLRKERLQFFINPNNDAIPLISTLQLREYLQTFNQLKIDSQFERVFRKALEELRENQLLTETEQDSGIFEITPICEIVLPVDNLNEFEVKIKSYLAKGLKSELGESYA